MPLNLVCPECGQAHRVKDKYAGHNVRCKGCGISLQVPAPLEADFEVDEEEPLEDWGTEKEPAADAEDDYGIPAAELRPRRRKKKKKRRGKGQAAKPQLFVNRMQLAVLVIILVMASRFGFVPIWPIFSLRDFGLIQGLTLLVTIASLLAYVAMIVGGIGIFQREAYGAPLVEKAAWAKLILAGIGMISGVASAAQSTALLMGILRVAGPAVIFGFGFPIAIIWLIRHPEWDTPEKM